MTPRDAFFAGNRYAVFGARARGRAHGPVLIAALRKARKEAVVIDAAGRPHKGAAVVSSLAEALPVDGAVILPPSPWDETAEQFTRDALQQCRDAGLHAVWIYAAGSPDPARALAAELDIQCVGDVCPCLHIEGAGFPHNLHRWLLRVTGQLQRHH